MLPGPLQLYSRVGYVSAFQAVVLGALPGVRGRKDSLSVGLQPPPSRGWHGGERRAERGGHKGFALGLRGGCGSRGEAATAAGEQSLVGQGERLGCCRCCGGCGSDGGGSLRRALRGHQAVSSPSVQRATRLLVVCIVVHGPPVQGNVAEEGQRRLPPPRVDAFPRLFDAAGVLDLKRGRGRAAAVAARGGRHGDRGSPRR